MSDSKQEELNLGGEAPSPSEAQNVERDKTGRFLPGNKSGGRTPGAKNKRSGAIDEIFSSLSHNAAERLIWLSKRVEARLSAFDKAQADISKEGGKPAPQDALREDEQLFYQTNKTLLEYQYPKLRAIEVSASRFSGVQFVINAGGEKALSGEAWVEESLTENIEIAKKKAAELNAQESEKRDE